MARGLSSRASGLAARPFVGMAAAGLFSLSGGDLMTLVDKARAALGLGKQEPIEVPEHVLCEKCARPAESLGVHDVAGKPFTLWRCSTPMYRNNDPHTSCNRGGSFWALSPWGQVYSDSDLDPFGYRFSKAEGLRILKAALDRVAERVVAQEASDQARRCCVNVECEAHLSECRGEKCNGCGKPTRVRSSFQIRCAGCDQRPNFGWRDRGVCRCGGQFVAKEFKPKEEVAR
jgi:hypothetical protein